MNVQFYKQIIGAIGFIPEDKTAVVYSKTYFHHKNFTISIDFEKQEINYPLPLTICSRDTCNFRASENFVVLECLDRLLEKGYKPENMTLEKTWDLGHKGKGRADIIINSPKSDNEESEKSFLIIECKTWGDEFDREFSKMLDNGGLLLSYYQQEPATKFLCLYASTFENNKIRYTNRIIEVKPEFIGHTKTEIFKIWKDQLNQAFKYNGIFDDDATPYNIVLKNLKRKDLVELQQSDSGYIYNQFAEILRHNVVSDKPNAFNKMFNLILSKIVDEEKDSDDILDFQWRDDDDDIELQKRLNDLYKYGMLEFLKKEVTDLDDTDLNKILKNNTDKLLNDLIRKRVTALRLHKNNEFAFKEVFNERSFNDNAIIVQDAVKLLQPYQLRYSHKQQFLSNFFELLLSNTLKQEAGQFFTPVPVARFIIKSLPLKEITERKISEKKGEFLPYVMDYAAGSGHFLTEAMDELQQIVEKLEPKSPYKTIRENIKEYKDAPYKWADKYIYGIEKDYRLAKITKVSCFLNGDGLANILHADGLDSFNCDDYKGSVLLSSNKVIKDNPNFDVLVANPPYSVSSFIKTLPKGKECFDIFPSFTEQSKEIECVFIERAKQIVKEDGLVGIVLPSSILNNSGVYAQTREILFKHFKIIAIVEFGSATFMATGTNTITLFLKRRKDTDHQEIHNAIERFFENGFIAKEVNAIENPFETYVNTVFQVDLSDYQSFVNRQPNDRIKQTELFQDYEKWYNGLTETKHLKDKIGRLENAILSLKKVKIKEDKDVEKTKAKIQDTEIQLQTAKNDLIRLFYDKVFSIEQDKMLYFFLSTPQEVLVIKTNPIGNNDKEKQFLGYEFSTRRGHEGLKMFTDMEGNLTTKLYSETNHKDETKISSYIYKAMCGETVTNIHASLTEHITITPLSMLMNFNQVSFDKEVFLTVKRQFTQEVSSNWEIVRLGDVTEILGGGTPKTNNKEYWNEGAINWATLVDTKNKYLYQTARKITEKGLKNSNATLLPINTVIFSSRATIGDVTIAKAETCTNQGYKNFICKPDRINYEYLYYILKSEAKNIESIASGMTYPEISKSQIAQYKIPLPTLEIQKQIISEIQEIENNPTKFLNGNIGLKEAEKIIKKLREGILNKYLY